jgi:hypothetical protein
MTLYLRISFLNDSDVFVSLPFLTQLAMEDLVASLVIMSLPYNEREMVQGKKS